MKIAIIVCLVIIVGIGVAMFTGVCGGGSISFTLQLDGKPLPASAQPEVSIDGKPYTPGEAIRPGSHNLTVKLSNASPFGKSFRVIWGDLNFGPLPLSTLKCELNIAVEPSPASIVLRQGTEQIESGHSPATFSIPAGSYVVEVMRGEYSEYKPIDVLANSKTNLNILLNLGGVALSSDPDDAEFKLAGNGHLWQGSLPTNIVDVPTGNYSLVARRKGWEINSDVAVRV